jgi:hypothetical protein
MKLTATKIWFGVAIVAWSLVAIRDANAAGFAPLRLSDTGETCYTWTGGNFSAGSFSKCQPSVEVVVLQPVAAPPVPVASNVCPPQIILQPEPQRRRTVPHKPRPKMICKPA